MMKSRLLVLATFCVASVSFSMGGSSPKDKLNERDRETLQLSKNMMRYLNVIQWQVGLDVYDVTGPEEFLEDRLGMYYTGRLRIYRWGENTEVDVSEYQFNPDAGERWHVLREGIYWDDVDEFYALTYGGPNSLPLKEGDVLTVDVIGPEPDWSKFKR